MSHTAHIEVINGILQDIRSNNTFMMGSLTFVFAAYFRQTLPVIRRSDVINACLKSSELATILKHSTCEQI